MNSLRPVKLKHVGVDRRCDNEITRLSRSGSTSPTVLGYSNSHFALLIQLFFFHPVLV